MVYAQINMRRIAFLQALSQQLWIRHVYSHKKAGGKRLLLHLPPKVAKFCGDLIRAFHARAFATFLQPAAERKSAAQRVPVRMAVREDEKIVLTFQQPGGRFFINPHPHPPSRAFQFFL